MISKKGLTLKRILIFLFITFLMTWLYEICLIWPATKNVNYATALQQLMIGAAMFFPAIGVLITRLITKEGFQNAMIKPNFKGHIKYYLMAWFGPSILTVLGAIFYFLIVPDAFDPSMTGMINVLKEQAVNQGMDASQIPDIPKAAIYAQLISGVLFAPILNIFTCFGEEWGWRGYLLPKMKEKLPMLPMLFVNGIIWGLWHAPLTAIGHNYGMDYPGFPYLGILAMCLFCTVMGILFSYITLKTGSCIPAVLAHGAVNGFSAAPSLFTKSGFGNPFTGPLPTGIIGGMGFLITAIIIAILLVKEEKPADIPLKP